MRFATIIYQLHRLSIAATCGLLWLFTLRRWLFTLAALRPPRPEPTQAGPRPTVLLLIPARNEARLLPRCLSHIAALTFPQENLTVVVVNDGSDDATASIAAQWCVNRPNWHTHTLAHTQGKAAALNFALETFPEGEFVAVYDADTMAQTDALTRLLQPFHDHAVGAVTGRRLVLNRYDGVAATYAAIESDVHQAITVAAKDYLRLAPPLLGSNCVYRRTALVEVGQFRPNTLLEDADLTRRLSENGWQLRYQPTAVSHHPAPTTLKGYWLQHTRWSRGFQQYASQSMPRAANTQRSTGFRPIWTTVQRFENYLTGFGYVDRLVVLIAGVLSIRSRLVRPTLLISLLTPFVQIGAALTLTNAPRKLWQRIWVVPCFYIVDLLMSVSSFLNIKPQEWEIRQR